MLQETHKTPEEWQNELHATYRGSPEDVNHLIKTLHEETRRHAFDEEDWSRAREVLAHAWLHYIALDHSEDWVTTIAEHDIKRVMAWWYSSDALKPDAQMFRSLHRSVLHDYNDSIGTTIYTLNGSSPKGYAHVTADGDQIVLQDVGHETYLKQRIDGVVADDPETYLAYEGESQSPFTLPPERWAHRATENHKEIYQAYAETGLVRGDGR